VVRLQVGISNHFWANFILILLGGMPGIIHVLWLVLGKKTGLSLAGVDFALTASSAGYNPATFEGVGVLKPCICFPICRPWRCFSLPP